MNSTNPILFKMNDLLASVIDKVNVLNLKMKEKDSLNKLEQNELKDLNLLLNILTKNIKYYDSVKKK